MSGLFGEEAAPVQGSAPLPATLGQSLEAAAQLGAENTPVGALDRLVSLHGIENRSSGSPMISPVEAQQRFPWLDQGIDKPMPLPVVEEIANRKRQRKYYEDVIARSPQGALAKTARFFAGMAPYVIDPINLAAGAGAGFLMGKALLGGATQVTALRAAANTAASQFVGNLAVEPLPYFANKKEFEQYTAAEAVLNAAAPALLFGAGHFALGKWFQLKGERFKAEHAEIVSRQMAAGKQLGTDIFIKNELAKTNYDPDLNFVSVTPEKVSDIEVHASVPVAGEPLSSPVATAGNVPDLGGLASVTSSRFVANGAAETGQLVSARLSGRYLSLDSPLPASLHERLLSIPAAADAINARPDAPLSEVIELMRQNAGDGFDDAMTMVSKEAKAAGYDGYHSVQTKTLQGDPHDPHNAFWLFDGSKAQETSRVPADPSKAGELPAQQREAFLNHMQSPESNFLYDAKGQEFAASYLERGQDMAGDLKKEITSFVEEARASGNEAGAVALEAELARVDEEASAITSLVNCIAGGA